ncbi:MAG: SDR family NAD(P)-dependent oxidoreductase [Pseudomonadota bacterium]
MGRIALVTGANQGLGLALVRGLATELGPDDVVYLTARDPAKGRAALESLGTMRAQLAFERLDVTEEQSIADLADTIRDRHGGLDIVASNAAARITKERSEAEQVRTFIETNNHGSCRLLKRLMPLLRPGAHYAIIASSFGRLSNLPSHFHPLFDTDRLSLDDIEASMDAYVEAMEGGSAAKDGWPDWINVPSKIGQVATARVAARLTRETRPDDDILINAACPGLIDTEASRPWFDDMSKAQSPDDAARAVVDLLLSPKIPDAPSGELIRFGQVLPWKG